MESSGGGGRGPDLNPAKAHQKVEFPSLEHFLEDVIDNHVQTVRLDVFEDLKQSELSFVYYVSLTMFVTAQDPSGFVLYEYKEQIATITTTDRAFRDDAFLELAQRRRKEAEQMIRSANITVRRGRFTIPPGQLTGQAMTGTVIEAPFPANPMSH